VFAHGWLLFENDKMSKSRGNIVRPVPISEVMGVDALRYFLLREVVFGQDGSFSYDALVGRYNSDLANGLGNLASRTLSMVQQYRGGVIPASRGDAAIAEAAAAGTTVALAAYENFDFSRALEAIWGIVSAVDKFIVERAPWKLAKDPAGQGKLDETLYTAAEALRIITLLAAPVLPHSSEKIWRQLGFSQPVSEVLAEQLAWGGLAGGQSIGTLESVFPRLDAKLAIEKMQELEIQEKNRQAELLGHPKIEAAAAPSETAAAAKSPAGGDAAGYISIDDFGKVDLRVGVVKQAEAVKGADKLLHLKVDIGEAEPRTIVAGIALAYKPEDLIGRKVVIVANLQPRKLRGLTSQGMIVAASVEGGLPILAGFHEDIAAGARLK